MHRLKKLSLDNAFVLIDGLLFFVAVFGPSGFGGFYCNFASPFRSKGLQPALATDLAAFAAHGGHDAGYVRLCDLGGAIRGFIAGSGAVNHLESGLVDILRV
jgi:hypothetical protein